MDVSTGPVKKDRRRSSASTLRTQSITGYRASWTRAHLGSKCYSLTDRSNMEVQAGHRVLLTNGVSYPYRVVSVDDSRILVRLSGNADNPLKFITIDDVAAIETESGWHRP